MKANVIKQNLGIDIAKDDFKVCFQQMFEDQNRRIKASRTFKNTLTGFKELVKWTEKYREPSVQVRMTIEATGVYYESVVHFFHDKTDYHISVVLPNKSKAFAKSLNAKSKTDKIDARILGQMGLERNLDRWQPISPSIRVIKQLCRERVALMEEKIALMNKLHALTHAHNPHKDSIKRLQKRIAFTVKLISQVEKQITKLVLKDKELKERIDKACQVKGLGLITVVTVIAETDGFDLFTSRAQLTGFAGYDVVENQSGTSVRGKTRISKKGNRFIRRALYFPAITAIKHEPHLKDLYDRIFDRTGIKMKGYVAVQRKLLLLIYALFTKNEHYDRDYQKNKNHQNESRQTQVPAYAG